MCASHLASPRVEVRIQRSEHVMFCFGFRRKIRAKDWPGTRFSSRVPLQTGIRICVRVIQLYQKVYSSTVPSRKYSTPGGSPFLNYSFISQKLANILLLTRIRPTLLHIPNTTLPTSQINAFVRIL